MQLNTKVEETVFNLIDLRKTTEKDFNKIDLKIKKDIQLVHKHLHELQAYFDRNSQLRRLRLFLANNNSHKNPTTTDLIKREAILIQLAQAIRAGKLLSAYYANTNQSFSAEAINGSLNQLIAIHNGTKLGNDHESSSEESDESDEDKAAHSPLKIIWR